MYVFTCKCVRARASVRASVCVFARARAHVDVSPSLQVDELARLCAYHSERIVDLANRTGASHHIAHASDVADAALDRRLAVLREQLLHEVCQLGAESSLRSQALTDRARA